MHIVAALRKWQSAGMLAQHLLKENGPQTSQQLYKACQAVNAPAAKPYIAPHHRDYRVINGEVRLATVRPPNPLHIVRSLRHLKQTLQGLEARAEVAHLRTSKWVSTTSNEEKLADLNSEAERIEKSNKAAGESEYVWIDMDRYRRTPRPSNLSTNTHSEDKAKPRIRLSSLSSPGYAQHLRT